MITEFTYPISIANQSTGYTELYAGNGNNIITDVNLTIEYANNMNILQFVAFIALVNANPSTINYGQTVALLGYGFTIANFNHNGKIYLQNSPLWLETSYAEGQNIWPASINGYIKGKLMT